MKTFGLGEGRCLLIWRVEKAFYLHLVGKGLETDHNISIFQQTLHPESPQPINHIRTDVFSLFFYVFLSFFFFPLLLQRSILPAFTSFFFFGWTLESTVKSICLPFQCAQHIRIFPRAMLHSVPPNVPCLFACVIVFSSVEYWLT